MIHSVFEVSFKVHFLFRDFSINMFNFRHCIYEYIYDIQYMSVCDNICTKLITLVWFAKVIICIFRKEKYNLDNRVIEYTVPTVI